MEQKNKQEKTKYANKGDKITEQYCPNCNEKLIVQMDNNSTEVFVCDKCKFKVKKK